MNISSYFHLTNYNRIYVKINSLSTLRDDMLKVRMRKEIIKIEMKWPTKDKETMVIGPFYKKIRRNAI